MNMEPKKQIFVLPGISNELSGKTVKEIAFHLGRYHMDENQVILTFTDDTFIAFGIERDEDDIMLVNNHFPPLESYGSYPPHKVDANGNVCFEDYDAILGLNFFESAQQCCEKEKESLSGYFIVNEK